MAPTSDTVSGDRVAEPPLPPRITQRRRRRRPSGEPPPLPRQLSTTGRYWLALGLVVLVFLVVVGVTARAAVAVDVMDRTILGWIAELRTPWLTRVMRGIGWLASPLALQLAWLASLAVLLVTRRWRHLFVLLGAMAIVAWNGPSELLQRPRPLGIEILGPWQGFAMPSRPVAVLAATLVSILYALVPQGPIRQNGKLVAAALVALVAASRLYLAQDALTDVITGAIIGVTVPLVLFRLFAPNEVFPVTYRRGSKAHLDVTGPRGEAIQHALEDQLGVIPVEIKPFGLEGSGGSTPLRVKVKGDPDTYLFCKLYAATHLRSDRWYKLGRTLLYGRLEDEASFHTVRRLVQYEDYALRLLHSAKLPVPAPGGIVEITPEREYLLVAEFLHGAKEIGDAEIDEDVIDQGLKVVRQLWDAGLAHRDIKPANLLVRDGRLLVIDSAFAEVRPSPWRQAVDLANMMLVLALRTDPERVYARARIQFSDDEIAEAFAATRGLTMPSQLRRLIRAQGRDLHEEFKRLLPAPVTPIAIQRWSWRRVALWVGVLLALLLGVSIVIPLLGGPL